MNDILELINSLPLVMSYIIYGFIFVSIFNFITIKRISNENNHLIISYISISFILRCIYEYLFGWLDKNGVMAIQINSDLFYIVTIALTIVMSYISGILFSSKFINNVLLHIGIKRTVNKNIWQDITEDNMWMFLKFKEEDYGYLGMYKYVEEKTDKPRILLNRYQLIEVSTGEAKVDYSNEANRCILIDTNDIDTIEMIYTNGDKDSFLSKIKHSVKKRKASHSCDTTEQSE